jgi:hypothetical protein
MLPSEPADHRQSYGTIRSFRLAFNRQERTRAVELWAWPFRYSPLSFVVTRQPDPLLPFPANAASRGLKPAGVRGDRRELFN